MPYKNKEKKRKYNSEYQKKWREKNKDKMRIIWKKTESRPERKEYRRNWWKSEKAKAIKKRYYEKYGRQYQKNYYKKNPGKLKTKYSKYYNSIKGIINHMKKEDKKKFKVINNDITFELIEMVNSRDKFCVYCNKDLSKTKYNYDHLKPFKPFSKFNMIRCCDSCNKSKNNSNVLDWLEFKGLKPSLIVLELLEKQKNL